MMQYAPVFFVDYGVPPAIITQEDMAPIVDSITSNIGVLLPIVFCLSAVFIGVKIVPKLLSRFTRF